MKKKNLLFALYLLCFNFLLAQPWKQLNDIGANQTNTFLPSIPGNAARFTVSGKIFVVAGSNASIGFTNKCYQFDPVTYLWIPKNNFPDSVGFPVSFVINNIAYVGSGFSNKLQKVSNQFWKYNESSDTWTPIAPMPESRNVAVGFAIKNLGYVGLGTDSTNNHQRKEFFSYDPNTNQWKSISGFGGTERNSACAFVINNKAYVGTGINGSSTSIFKDFWRYDPDSNSWMQVADYPGNVRYRALSFVLNNVGYVGTGVGSSFLDQFKDFYKFNDSTNTWKPIQDLPIPLDYAIAISDGIKVFVGKGTTGQGNNVRMYSYDVNLNKWNFIKENYGVNRAASFTSNNKIYVVGGQSYDLDFNRQIWEYNPVNNEWKQKTDFPGNARVYGQSCFAIGNEGYLVGGSSNGLNVFNDCWKYNTVTDSWTSIASLPIPRNNATTFTINNKGYVSCGSDNQNNYLHDCWEYNPVANVWVLKDSLPASARNYTTGFSLNNFGYVIGGIEKNGTLINEVWTFEPVSGKWTKKNNINNEGIYAAMGTSTSTDGYISMGRGIDNTNYFQVIRAYNPTGDLWTDYSNYPLTPVIFGISESVNNKLYMGLGSNIQNNSCANFWEFDPNAGNGIHSFSKPSDINFNIESPFTNVSKLFYYACPKGNLTLTFYDNTGKLIRESEVEIIKDKGFIVIEETKNWNPGIYLVCLQGEQFFYKLKMIKVE